jgi:DNA-binding transcriptional LysR family regulator
VLLGQIQGFVEVARTGNVSRAAEALFVTQPALTARLKGLERDLGAPLFTRSRRGMQLSEAGRAFLPYAHRALEAVSEGRALVAELGRGVAGQLAIGAAPAVSTYVLPRMLKRFHTAHPRVRLAVRTGHSEEVLQLVLRGQVEIGLVRELRHDGVAAVPLYEDELVLVADPEHRFAAAGRIEVRELADEELILFDRTSSYYDVTSAFFRSAGVTPRGAMELDNIDATKKMVAQGLGVALVPHTAVADELAAGTLRAVAVTDVPPVRRRIVAIQRREAGPPAGVAAAFLGTLRDVQEDLGGRAFPRRVWLT